MREQGKQDGSQLAAAQPGTSQGSAMQAGMEQALQHVLGHMCSCLMQAATACLALCLLPLLHMPLGVPHAWASDSRALLLSVRSAAEMSHQRCWREPRGLFPSLQLLVPLSTLQPLPAQFCYGHLLSRVATVPKAPGSACAWILAERRAGSRWA